MSQGNMIYLGLCVRYEPPIIGVHYKNKQTDEKKKVYTIVLQRLIFNPNPMQVTEQLYLEHPHILKENKISKDKIAALVQKIQKELRIGDEYDDEDQEEDYEEEYEHDDDDNGANQPEDEDEPQEEPKKQPEQPEQPSVPQKKRPKFDFDKDFGRDDGPLNRSM